MATLESILSQAIVQRIGWTLVHFLWQGAAVAAVAAVVLKILRNSSANVRYVTACVILAAMAAMPLITFQCVRVDSKLSTLQLVQAEKYLATEGTENTEKISIQNSEVRIQNEEEKNKQTTNVRVDSELSTLQLLQSLKAMIESVLSYVVVGWLVGVFGLSLWHLGGWTQLQRLWRRMVKSVDLSLRDTLDELAELLHIRGVVAIAESALVQVPTVIGWLRPIILLPASAMTGLSGEQLEAILAHELAHIKRHDYLVNMLQTAVEILGFYHPAVWWVSGRIRLERENCCDDTAVGICGDRICYAKALATMEEIRGGQFGLAVAASGGSLFERIGRLMGRAVEKERAGWMPSSISFVLLITVMAIVTSCVLRQPSHIGKEEPQAYNITEQFEQAKRNSVTLKQCTNSEQLEAEIARARKAVEKFKGGHVIVGRVVLDGPGDVRNVISQMEILEDGYFASETKDLIRPVGFRMHQYAPYDLQLGGMKGPLVDVGTIHMTPLPEDQLVDLKGQLAVENGGDFSGAVLYLRVTNGPINTPHNGTSGYRYYSPESIVIRPSENGLIEASGFSPIEYYCTIMTPDYLKKTVRIKFQEGQTFDLGTITLEKPKQIELSYIVSEHPPFDLNGLEKITIPAGTRWRASDDTASYGWDLEFAQDKGSITMKYAYAPCYLRDLGVGQIAHFLNANQAQISPRQPNDWKARNQHVYLLHQETWKHWVLFKVSIEGEPLPQPEPTVQQLIEPNAVGELVWGRPVNGLRAAVEFIPERQSYSLGQPVSIRFHIQNISDHIIEFTTASWRLDNTWCMVDDAYGEITSSQPMFYTGLATIERKRLVAGQSTTIESASLGFAEDDKHGFSHPVGWVVILKPGEYSLRYKLRFPDVESFDPKGRPWAAEPNDWKGTLETGKRLIKIVAADPNWSLISNIEQSKGISIDDEGAFIDKAKQDWRARQECLSRVMDLTAKLRHGQTRGELEKYFIMDGGKQIASQQRYDFIECPFVKVKVEFEPRDPNYLLESKSDKIVFISLPYFEEPCLDKSDGLQPPKVDDIQQPASSNKQPVRGLNQQSFDNALKLSAQAAQPKADNNKEKILVEGRFFMVDSNGPSIAKFLNTIGIIDANIPADNTLGQRTFVLDDLQAATLAKWLQSQKEAQMLQAPKVLVLDGEQATLSVTTDKDYIVDYKEPNELGAKPEPVQKTITTGTIFNVTPQLQQDKQFLHLEIKYKMTSVGRIEKKIYKPGYEIERPLVNLTELQSTVGMPAGQTVLMSLGGLASMADDGTTKNRTFYILVKAAVIVIPKKPDPDQRATEVNSVPAGR